MYNLDASRNRIRAVYRDDRRHIILNRQFERYNDANIRKSRTATQQRMPLISLEPMALYMMQLVEEIICKWYCIREGPLPVTSAVSMATTPGLSSTPPVLKDVAQLTVTCWYSPLCKIISQMKVKCWIDVQLSVSLNKNCS